MRCDKIWLNMAIEERIINYFTLEFQDVQYSKEIPVIKQTHKYIKRTPVKRYLLSEGISGLWKLPYQQLLLRKPFVRFIRGKLGLLFSPFAICLSTKLLLALCGPGQQMLCVLKWRVRFSIADKCSHMKRLECKDPNWTKSQHPNDES